MPSWSSYFDKLRGDVCECGAYKAPKHSLCKGCYYLLPDTARRALYRRIGDGYEAAYDHAVAVLKLKGRIKEA